MELRYKLEEHYIKDYFYKLRKKSYLIGVAIGGVAVFIISFLQLQEYLPNTWPIIIGLTAVCVIALHFLFILLNRSFVKAITKKMGKEFFDSVQTISLMEDGVFDHSNLQDIKIPYNGIRKIEETTEYITIKANASLIFIPIESIQNPEDKSAFIADLKSRIH